MNVGGRSALMAGLIAIIVVIAVWVVRASSVDELRVVTVQGSAERVRGDERAALAVGAVLAVGDRLRTAAESTVTLQYGEDARVKVEEGSSLSVRGIDDEGLALELESGRLRATVRPESGRLRVISGERAAVSTGGELAVAAEDGVFGVEAVEGGVEVTGVDGVSRVDAGQSMVIAGASASVGQIQKDLLLSVDWPEQTTQATITITVVTAPSSVVTARGPAGEVKARASRDGKAFLQVPLQEGDNEVEIIVVDPFARRKTRREVLRRDSTRPLFRIEVE